MARLVCQIISSMIWLDKRGYCIGLLSLIRHKSEIRILGDSQLSSEEHLLQQVTLGLLSIPSFFERLPCPPLILNPTHCPSHSPFTHQESFFLSHLTLFCMSLYHSINGYLKAYWLGNWGWGSGSGFASPCLAGMRKVTYYLWAFISLTIRWVGRAALKCPIEKDSGAVSRAPTKERLISNVFQWRRRGGDNKPS